MGLCAGHQALHEPLEAAQKLLQALQTCSTPQGPLRSSTSGPSSWRAWSETRAASLHGMAAGGLEVKHTVWQQHSARCSRGEAWEGKGGRTWEEEGAQVGPTRAHEACEHAEGRLLRQVHQDDARHKGHALTVRHLQRAPTLLRCTACSACLPSHLYSAGRIEYI